MSFIWALVWFLNDAPPLHRWNTWLTSLVVCVVVDVVGGLRSR